MARIDPNPDAELTIQQHEQRLESGWKWLEAEWALLQKKPNRRDAEQRLKAWFKREDLWLEWEQAYKRDFNAIKCGTVPHVQEAFL